MHFARSWSLPFRPDDIRTRAVDVGRRRAAHLADGSHDVQVSCRREGGEEVVHLARRVPTGVSGPATALVGRFLLLEHIERWHPPDRNGAVEAELRVAFPGRPMTVVGRIVVTPTADGCRQRSPVASTHGRRASADGSSSAS